MLGNKIIGIILLILGILMIFWSLYVSYNIFQDKKPVPEIFRPSAESAATKIDKGSTPQEVDQQIKQTVQEQMANILPQENIYKLLNLIAWSIFAWLVIVAGAKVSSLGIGMLK